MVHKPSKRRDRWVEERAQFAQEARPFLNRLGLTPLDEDVSSGGLYMRFGNGTAGVQFEFVPLDQAGWMARVALLVGGRFPPVVIFYSTNLLLNQIRFDVRDFVMLRGEAAAPQVYAKVSAEAALSLGDVCVARDLLRRCLARRNRSPSRGQGAH